MGKVAQADITTMQDDSNIPVIVFDTNGIYGIGRKDTRLWVLLEQAKLGAVKVIIPYVAFFELVKRRASQKLEARLKDRMTAAEDQPHWATVLNETTEEWFHTFENCGVEIVRIEDRHMSEANRRRAKQLPPFTGRTGAQHDNDFRDALIFCSIQEISAAHENLIVVSGDGALRKTLIDELGLEVWKDGKKLISKIFNQNEINAEDPFKSTRASDATDSEFIKQKYSHPDFEVFQPDRSHNAFDIEGKLNEFAENRKDQVCCVIAVAKLFQPASVANTVAALSGAPFEYSDIACKSALEDLEKDGSIKILDDVIIVQNENFAEQAIGKLGDRVVDLGRSFYG